MYTVTWRGCRGQSVCHSVSTSVGLWAWRDRCGQNTRNVALETRSLSHEQLGKIWSRSKTVQCCSGTNEAQSVPRFPRQKGWRRIMFSNISEAQSFLGYLFVLNYLFLYQFASWKLKYLPNIKKPQKKPHKKTWILQVFYCPPYKSVMRRYDSISVTYEARR